MTYWSNINWSELETKCPIDIRNIVIIANDIRTKLDIKKFDETVLERVMSAKSNLNVGVRLLLNLICEKITEKSDQWVFFKLQNDFAGLVLKLEGMANSMSTWQQQDAMKENKLLGLICCIEEILYGDIYYALLNASEKEPKDPRNFMYALNQIISLNVGVFGPVSTTSKHKTSDSPKFTFNYKDLLGETAQKDLNDEGEEEYEKQIKMLKGG